MASFNKVILLGNLTRDPEIRYTPKGSAVCDLGVAVNRQYTLDNGEKREEVTYVDVVLWARLAEIAGEYLKKGRSVYIEGRLQTRKYTDKDGVEKYSTEIVADRMQLLGGREGGGAGGGDVEFAGATSNAGASRREPAAGAAKSGGAKKNTEDFDDDIPF